jgi:hypothetical protein
VHFVEGAGGRIWYDRGMIYLVIKALISGAIVATVSEVAKRYPGLGGLIASLPLVSVLGMMWLWHDTHDPDRMMAHVTGTFWFVLPSLPMFLVIPELMRRGLGFWAALAIGCLLTMVLYGFMVWAGPRVGIRL